jgi:glycosyltransferase involved in cell wall biosynthesis
MKRLNILVSAYACNPIPTEDAYPGEAILGWNLIKQLSRFYDLTVLTRTYNRKNLENEVKTGGISNTRFVYLTLPPSWERIKKSFLGFSLYYLLWQIKAYIIARRLRKDRDFDVFHHITFNNDWMPSFIGAFIKIPFIWGPMGGGQQIPRCLKTELRRKTRLNERMRLWGQWFFRHSYFRLRGMKRARAVLVCNRDTQRIIPARPERVHFFPVNGISMDEFPRLPTEKRNGGVFRVIYAGRLDPIKGLGLGIKAFEIFLKNHPDATWEIVGQGPEFKRLERLIADKKLQGKVFITPWLDQRNLMKKISDSDVLFFPSFRDGGGAVIVEAMAFGKPVIGLDIGGPGYHIRPAWGIKVQARNHDQVIEDLAGALETLSRDEESRERLGKAGRKRALEFYLWDKLGDQLHDIYQGVLPPT